MKKKRYYTDIIVNQKQGTLRFNTFEDYEAQRKRDKKKDKKAAKKGHKGEKKTSRILSKLKKEGYTIFDDVLIKSNGRTSQIDHIAVSKYGIFVVETKNYSGLIKDDCLATKWTYNPSGVMGKNIAFYSPYRQNETHIEFLSRVMETEEEKFRSVVCFSDNAILTDRFAMSGKHILCRHHTMLKFISMYQEVIFTDEEVAKYCNIIKDSNIKGKKARQEHAEYWRRHYGLKDKVTFLCENTKTLRPVPESKIRKLYSVVNFNFNRVKIA